MKKLILFITILLIKTGSAQVAIIAHSNVPVDSITQAQLLDYYTGEIQVWENNLKVTVFDLKPKLDIREKFYNFLGKSSSRMKSIWLKRMLAGEGDPPKTLESEQMILSKIETTPGSIGFVSESAVQGNVKILYIIE